MFSITAAENTSSQKMIFQVDMTLILSTFPLLFPTVSHRVQFWGLYCSPSLRTNRCYADDIQLYFCSDSVKSLTAFSTFMKRKQLHRSVSKLSFF